MSSKDHECVTKEAVKAAIDAYFSDPEMNGVDTLLSWTLCNAIDALDPVEPFAKPQDKRVPDEDAVKAKEKLLKACQLSLHELRIYESEWRCDCSCGPHLCGLERLRSSIAFVEQALAQARRKLAGKGEKGNTDEH